jgi:hypothetical protein
MDLAALHEGGLAEDRPHRFAQRFGAIQDDEQTAVGSQPAALEIGQEVLTHTGVLGRAIPQAQRVFLAVGGDPERHDEAMLADVHAVDHQSHQLEGLQRRGLPGRQLRRRLRHKAAADGALARAAAPQRGRDGLQAARIASRRDPDEHLLDHAPIQRIDIRHGSERRQRDFVAARPHTGPPYGHLSAAEHDLAAHRAGARRLAAGHVRVPLAADRGPILFQHRF